MSDRHPQPTDVLIHRLRRVAKAIREVAEGDPKWQAYANTCDQAAGRLEDLNHTWLVLHCLQCPHCHADITEFAIQKIVSEKPGGMSPAPTEID
jgi:hypothetical protein